MLKQVELFITFCEKADRPLTPLQKGSLRRVAMHADFLKELHRAPSPMCPDTITDLVAEAKARMARPKQEKADYTPPRPEGWQTAFLVSPVTSRKVKEQTTQARSRKHVGAQSKATHKGYGKGGIKIINIIARAAHTRLQLADAISYAR